MLKEQLGTPIIQLGTKLKSRALVWLRRDLRLYDNKALYRACEENEEVLLCFVFDTEILNKLKNKNDRRVDLIFQAIELLRAQLKKHNSDLVVLYGNPAEKIPKLASDLNAQKVYANEDYEPYAKKRDLAVKLKLKKLGKELLSFKDQVIFSGSEILKSDGSPYKVFTPYKKAWLSKLRESDYTEFTPRKLRLVKKDDVRKFNEVKSLAEIGFKKTEFKIKDAKKILNVFSSKMSSYQKERDFPAVDGTSQISPYLRFGIISVRDCVRLCMPVQKSTETWLSELVWRDFYHMILDQYPHVEKEAFLEKYKNIKWLGHSDHFKLWCAGKTGYPIVDAAMRQLNETGWMHNRLRMIVASFLVKDLLIDWRKGESYFAEKLIDYDLASNNGGWQWCASTGCDAQPYFRIFNPDSQSIKFDPDGIFIKKFVPELAALSAKEIHNPQQSRPKQYPERIVEHSTQRALALSMYKKATLS